MTTRRVFVRLTEAEVRELVALAHAARRDGASQAALFVVEALRRAKKRDGSAEKSPPQMGVAA